MNNNMEGFLIAENNINEIAATLIEKSFTEIESYGFGLEENAKVLIYKEEKIFFFIGAAYYNALNAVSEKTLKTTTVKKIEKWQ